MLLLKIEDLSLGLNLLNKFYNINYSLFYMKLIKELRDLGVTGKDVPKNKKDYWIRIAARAIILNSKGEIAILSTPKSHHYHHKLPGGGLEENEDVKKALIREIREETGCEIDIIKEVGEIIEYKNKDNLKQISYCFLAKVKGKIGKTNYTKAEKDAGYELEWMPINNVIKLFEDGKPVDYSAKFIQLRDYNFLIEGKKLLK